MENEEIQLEITKALNFTQLYHQTDDEDLRAEIKKVALDALKKLHGDK